MEGTNETMWVEYPSKVSEIVDRNKSFDSCMLRICYPGTNRNRTNISRNAIEAAIPTIYYCPIVCNYDVETDEIGGHDVGIVRNESGLRLVNLTDPIGVIPEGAAYHWETIDDGGEEHDYLCIEGLLWKRSAAYSKVKRDGITSQSMEITINSGKNVNGIYEIYSFDFTAFCLLGDGLEPCFESAEMETFSLEVSKARFSRMMADLKASYTHVTPANADEIHNYSKGGNEAVDDLLAKYGLSSADIDFDTNGMKPDEIEQRFAAIADSKKFSSGDDAAGENAPDDGAGAEDAGAENTEPEAEPEPTPLDAEGTNTDGAGEGEGVNNQATYSITEGQLTSELSSVLREMETFHDEFWDEELARYYYLDHDCMLGEVYFADRKERSNAFGASFTMNGDVPVIDMSTKKRKKIAYVDFDEGAVATEGASVYSEIEEYAKVRYSKLKEEVEELRSFKAQKDSDQRAADEQATFAKFEDLTGNADFEALRSNCKDYTIDQIEEKCFAIRGRNMTATFSANTVPEKVRVPIDGGTAPEARNDEPYGGVFLRYGFGARK